LAPGYIPHTTGFLVEALAFSANGATVYAGGSVGVTGVGIRHLAAFDAATGAVAATQPPDADDKVVRLLTSGNLVYAAGHFTKLGGVTRPYIGAFSSSTGALDTKFTPAVGSGLGVEVTALAIAGSRLYFGGEFLTVGGRNHQNIAAVNSSTGAVDDGWLANVNGAVRRLAVLANHLYAAGAFNKAGASASASRDGLAAFSLTNGGLSPDWHPSLGGSAANGFAPPGCPVCARDASPGSGRSLGTGLFVSGNKLLVGDSSATVDGAIRPGFAVFRFVKPAAAPPAAKVLGFPWPGQRLACRVGGFRGGPETYAFAWLRDGHVIASGSQTHRLAFGDVGHRIACRVTGVNPAGSGSETSASVKITLRPGGPKMKISSAAVRAARSGVVSISVTCPRGFTLCAGTLSLRSASKLNGKFVSFGSGSFSLHGARSQPVQIKLSSANLQLLKQKGSIRCQATALAHDASNRYGLSSTQLTLRAPK
jgi:outer membrane protein assembly factor BamB